ncbi:hypothetical protein TNCT_435041 [Trichonephila clavata]|uniref:Uncharacterized protein n=1 Tax=Trichonephila clavata TaxID=2740835 RepID=A0A8X6KIZ8_TRICU|nr:hypothetical protein TNCT_435041 [Trichonephila clavata]
MHSPNSRCNNLGSVTYESWSTLIVVRWASTENLYVDGILQFHVKSFLGCLPETTFQQNQACLHTAVVAQDFLRQV